MRDEPGKLTCAGRCCGGNSKGTVNTSDESGPNIENSSAPVAINTKLESGCCSDTFDQSETLSCYGDDTADERAKTAAKDVCCVAFEAEASCHSAKPMSSCDKTLKRDDCCAGSDADPLAKPETMGCAESVDNCCDPAQKESARSSEIQTSGVIEKAAGNCSGMKNQCCSPASKKPSCCAESSASVVNAGIRDEGCCAVSVTKEPALDVAKKDAIVDDCCVEVKAGCCDGTVHIVANVCLY